MSEQLSFSLNIDASAMMQSAATATKELETKFKQVNSNIRAEFGKPLEIQAEFNLDGDHVEKTYNALVKSQDKIIRQQSEINKNAKKANAAAKKSAALQRIVTSAVKGTTQEKKSALKLIEKLLRNTQKTKAEMIELSKAARTLRDSLPKKSAMDFSMGGGDFGKKSLTGAGVAANLLVKAMEMVATAIIETIKVGMKMQTLNLQMEAFTGGATQAKMAMSEFARIAENSPLDVLEVAEAGKIMMAFGVSTSEATEATERLAIVSAATGGDMNLLARNMGQIQAQGRAYTRDLTQFAIQGIPIWEEMSQVTGKSVAQLKEMASDGEIGMQTVSQALRNMTAEGTAFAEVADRMQETFAGKLAKLQSAFQTAAGSIIEDVALIDESIGASDKLMLFLKSLAKDTSQLGVAMENSAYSAAIMRESVADVSDTVKAADDANRSWSGSFGLFNSAAGTVSQIARETDGARIISDSWGVSMTTLTQRLAEMIAEGSNLELVEEFQGIAQELGMMDAGIETSIKGIMKMAGVTNESVEAQKAEYEALREAAREKLTDIELKYDELKESAIESFEETKAASNKALENSQKIVEGLQEQIAATRELGPAGEALAALRRRELEYTAATGKQLEGHITKEGRKKLEAQATLERMDNQAKAAELQERLLVEQIKQTEIKKRTQIAEAKMQAEVLKIEEKKKEAIGDQTKAIEDLTDVIDNLKEILAGDLQKNWGTIEGLIDDSQTETNKLKGATDLYAKEIGDAIGNYDTVIRRLDTIKKRILNMPKLPSGPPNNFAGGPVSGGSAYTVNELGKEAFLSASGKLSMINAPAWGEWTAPSSGTIIPAHLTRQLNVPTGGVQLNKKASSKGLNLGGGGGTEKMLKGLVSALSGGDNVTNNVTIQSTNTTQAASDVMVQLAKLKRLRYN